MKFLEPIPSTFVTLAGGAYVAGTGCLGMIFYLDRKSNCFYLLFQIGYVFLYRSIHLLLNLQCQFLAHLNVLLNLKFVRYETFRD